MDVGGVQLPHMADAQAINDYLAKAAESELANRRFNDCANRCYYACFQAAIAVLLAAGIEVRSPGGRWRHQTVHAQFVEQLINWRRRYPPSLRRVLTDNMTLRHEADYESDLTSEKHAARALRRSREFVTAIQREEDGSP